MTEKKPATIGLAFIPIIILILLLFANVIVFGAAATDGPNQIALVLGAAIAGLVAWRLGYTWDEMEISIVKSIGSAMGAMLILLVIGSLSGTWLLSGIVPAMIYYGLKIMNPTIFLFAACVRCCIVSLATGSSWSTVATVGIALLGIGKALGIHEGWIAGAIISGAYFGDKMSPLSDTTNLAPAMAGTDLFTHIRYMLYTTTPTIIITLIVFIILGLNLDTTGEADTHLILAAVDDALNVSPWLFIVPILVIGLIIMKTSPLIALLIGTLLGGLAALIFQPEIVTAVGGGTQLDFETAYKGIMNAITVETSIPTENEALKGLFTAGGMSKM